MNNKLFSLLLTLCVFTFNNVWAQNNNAQTSNPPMTEASEQATSPINGAFGISLGAKFDPKMVSKVIAETPQTYSGKDKVKLQGKLLQVEPVKPDERFQHYSLKTTADGLIFTIQAEYQYEVEKAMGKKAGKVKNEKSVRKTCKNAVKAMAKEFEESYGQPRGKGWDGEWFSFRQLSDNADKSLRLYANRCRTGLYSIQYTDLKAQKSN